MKHYSHRILSPFALSQYLPQLPALQMRRRETPIHLRVHIADITVCRYYSQLFKVYSTDGECQIILKKIL